MSKKVRTYYDILQISETATDADVKRAYYRKVRHWHPDNDNNNADSAKAQRNFRLIVAAYSHLKTQPQRDAYNRYIDNHKRELKNNTVLGKVQNKVKTICLNIKEIVWPISPSEETRHGQ